MTAPPVLAAVGRSRRSKTDRVIDEDWVKARVAEQHAEDERRLTQAEAEAASSGKQVF
jgi:hypothetical protein